MRPEKIRLHDAHEEGQPGHNTLLGTIRDASYLGVSTSYIVEIRGGARLTVYEQNVERATRSELWAPGEEVRLTWAPEHTFVLRTEPAGPSDPTQTEPPAGGPAENGA